MKPQNVRIAAILDCKNGSTDSKRIEFRCEIEKSAAKNKAGFLMAGSAKFDAEKNVEKRVAYDSVSVARINEWGLKVGDLVAEKTGQPCQLIIIETTYPQYGPGGIDYFTQKPSKYQDKVHKPKVTNSTDNVVLTHGGAPIYRNTILTFDMSLEDVLLPMDPIPASLKKAEVVDEVKEFTESSENV